MAISFQLRSNNFEQAQKTVDDKVRQVLEQCGEEIEGYAKEDCPVDTGLLHNSITYGLGGQQLNQTHYTDDAGAQSGSYSSNAPTDQGEDSVWIGTNVKYACPVEFRDSAHHDVGKAHFMRDAGTTHLDNLQEIAKAIFGTI